MSKNKILQPKIRFKEFSGENAEAWEQRKLKEFGQATGGTSIESEFIEGGKYKVISIGSYSEQSVYKDQNIRVELTDKTRNRVLNKDDLTMILNDKTTSGNIIGRVLLIESDDSYVYNQRTERIEPDHKMYDSQFLYQMFNAPIIRSKIIKKAQGNTQIYVNWSVVSELDYLVPKLDEQSQIGLFFKYLDNCITLHQRKLETLESLKKTLLSKMFPKNGKAVPELRFAGFTDNWEQRKASELFKSISDKNHPNLPVLSASQEKGMILRDDIGIDIKYDHKSLSNYKRVTPGQFVIHLRSFQGGFADSQMEGITSPAYTVIDFKEKDQSHSLFWKEILTSQSFIKRLETVTYGIRDGRSISFSDFSTLKFIVPKLDEQEKIAVLFKILNQTITLHQRKIEQYQELKKTLLSKMFI